MFTSIQDTNTNSCFANYFVLLASLHQYSNSACLWKK